MTSTTDNSLGMYKGSRCSFNTMGRYFKVSLLIRNADKARAERVAA